MDTLSLAAALAAARQNFVVTNTISNPRRYPSLDETYAVAKYGCPPRVLDPGQTAPSSDSDLGRNRAQDVAQPLLCNLQAISQAFAASVSNLDGGAVARQGRRSVARPTSRKDEPIHQKPLGLQTETHVSADASRYRPLPRLRLRAQGGFRDTLVYLSVEPAD